MTESAQKCSKCLHEVPPGASFCPSCGAATAQAAPAPQTERSTKPPDRASLSGPCTVIYAGEEELDIRRVGRLIVACTKRPLPDITRDLRASKGVLASALGARVAVALAERIETDLCGPVLVVPDAQIISLPPAVRMRRIAINALGIRCDAYSWDNTESMEIDWNSVFLISCGRLEVQEVVESRDESGIYKDPIGRQLPNLVTNTHHEYVLDLVLRDPWRRLRLDQNTVAFSLTEMRRDRDQSLSTLHRSVMHLDRYAAGAPRNRGVGLLVSGAPEAAAQSLTFQSKRSFDLYTHWLMQLVRFGFPIAEQ